MEIIRSLGEWDLYILRKWNELKMPNLFLLDEVGNNLTFLPIIFFSSSLLWLLNFCSLIFFFFRKVKCFYLTIYFFFTWNFQILNWTKFPQNRLMIVIYLVLVLNNLHHKLSLRSIATSVICLFSIPQFFFLF